MTIDNFVVISLSGSKRISGFYELEESSRFRTFSAINGRALADGGESARKVEKDLAHLIDFEEFFRKYGRQMSWPEVGCALSHYQVMKEFASGVGSPRDWMVVAEDDARWPAGVPRLLRRALQLGTKADYILFGNPVDSFGYRHFFSISQELFQLTLFPKLIGFCQKKAFWLGKFHGELSGAGLYAVRRSAAKRYVEFAEAEGISWAADYYWDWAPRIGLQMMVCVPNLVSWEGESSIRVDENAQNNALRIAKWRESRGLLRIIRRHLALGLRVRRLQRRIFAARR